MRKIKIIIFIKNIFQNELVKFLLALSGIILGCFLFMWSCGVFFFFVFNSIDSINFKHNLKQYHYCMQQLNDEKFCKRDNALD